MGLRVYFSGGKEERNLLIDGTRLCQAYHVCLPGTGSQGTSGTRADIFFLVFFF